MRLINARTLKIEEFTDVNTPKYAILSHTWGLEELSLQEFCASTESSTEKSGYKKIQSCCLQTLKDGFQYCWVDTCCIDKTSSAELSEAINSMFKWYGKSEICYAYLADIQVRGSESPEDAMKGSKWFTRGWTLQELIAPERVYFYDKDWRGIGSKQDLRRLIENITGVDEFTLLNIDGLQHRTVARRMSWSAKRQTTRVEDMAYCLLGIFDINMPLLYGEGEKAFFRLQEEIIKESDDQTIFVWNYGIESHDIRAIYPGIEHGMLARHPSMFTDCGLVESIPQETGPSTITNKGLRIEIPILQHSKSGKVAVLACYFSRSGTRRPMMTRIAIPIAETTRGDGSFCRQPHSCPLKLEESELKSAKAYTIYLRRHDTEIARLNLERINQVFVEIDDCQTILLEATWAQKPLTNLTEYYSWTRLSDQEEMRTSSAKNRHVMDIDFPEGRQDHRLALRLKHIGDCDTHFIVLMETKYAREFLVTKVLPQSKRVSLKELLQETGELFEEEGTKSLWVTGHFQQRGVCSLDNGLTVLLSYYKRGMGARNGVRFDRLHFGVGIAQEGSKMPSASHSPTAHSNGGVRGLLRGLLMDKFA